MAPQRDRAMDYHSLPGDQNKSSHSKKNNLSGVYSKLAGDGASSGSFDEEPVKLSAENSESNSIKNEYQSPLKTTSGESSAALKLAAAVTAESTTNANNGDIIPDYQ